MRGLRPAMLALVLQAALVATPTASGDPVVDEWISRDGRFVVFRSVDDGLEWPAGLFVRDLRDGTTRLLFLLLPDFRSALGAPASFDLVTPTDGAHVVPSLTTQAIALTWTASSGEDGYVVELAIDPSFATIDYSAPLGPGVTT